MTRRNPDRFVCKGCGQLIKRYPAPARDNRREYCSLKCKMRVWWRTHECQRYPPSESLVLRRQIESAQRKALCREQQIERAIERVHWEQARTICSCGATIARDSGSNAPYCRLCRTCATTRIAAINRETRAAIRTEGVDHVCPNCGQSFRGYVDDVYCSSRCNKQMHKKKGRYPSIRGLPLDERNRLAELLALVRAARRRMDGAPDKESTAAPEPGATDELSSGEVA